jgi:NADH-quinone oxidoreductase subunit M
VAALTDVGWQDTLLFILLAVAIIGIGFYPAPLLNVMHTAVGQLLELSMQSKL